MKTLKTLKTLGLVSAVSVGLLGAGGVLAAEDGELGSDSTGSKGIFDITLYNNAKAKIWGLSDIDLDTNSMNNTGSEMQFCVYSNTSNVRFTVESDNGTLNAAESFNLKSSGGALLPYDLTLTATEGSQSEEIWGENGLDNKALSLKHFASAGDSWDDSNQPTCAAYGQNMKAEVVVTGTPSDPGAYSDRVYLVVTSI